MSVWKSALDVGEEGSERAIDDVAVDGTLDEAMAVLVGGGRGNRLFGSIVGRS